MQFTRRQSLALAWSILGLFFVIVVVFAHNERPVLVSEEHSESPTPIPVATSAAPLADNDTSQSSSITTSALTMQRFHRSETKDGKLLWEATGDKGEIIPPGNALRITNAEITSILKNGARVTLKTPIATAQIVGATLSGAQARNGVTIVANQDTTMTASSMDFNRTSGAIDTVGPISIVNPIKGSITSDNLAGNAETQEFTFTGNVVTTIQPRPSAKEKAKS